METTIVSWGYIGIMEKQMETTIVYQNERGEGEVALNPEPQTACCISNGFIMRTEGILVQGLQ